VVVVKFLKVGEQKNHGIASQTPDSPSSSDVDAADASNNRGRDENPSSILPKNKIDVKGAVALASGITFLLIALTYFEIGESSRSVSTSANFGTLLSLLVVSAISIILFIMFEKTSASPLIDLSCYKQDHSPRGHCFHDYGTYNVYGLSDRASICYGSIIHGFGGNTLTSSILLPIYNHIHGIVSICK
jgi:hypothetical protein